MNILVKNIKSIIETKTYTISDSDIIESFESIDNFRNIIKFKMDLQWTDSSLGLNYMPTANELIEFNSLIESTAASSIEKSDLDSNYNKTLNPQYVIE